MKLQSGAKRRDSQGGRRMVGWAQARGGRVREEGFQGSEETGGGGTERGRSSVSGGHSPAQPGHGCLRREQLKGGFSLLQGLEDLG